jgi:hypothetical protein
MSAARYLRGLLLILGASCFVIGLMHIAIGPSIIPGGVPVNATMDSEDRFFGALFAAYGAACLCCAGAVFERLTVAVMLAAAFFLGGLARLVSIAAVGLPHPFFIAMTAIETMVPPVMVWLAIVARRARAQEGEILTAHLHTQK